MQHFIAGVRGGKKNEMLQFFTTHSAKGLICKHFFLGLTLTPTVGVFGQICMQRILCLDGNTTDTEVVFAHYSPPK